MAKKLLQAAQQYQYDDVRILVADDEPQNLRVIGEILKRDGLQFIFATDGQEALQAAREEHPTLILLDIMMPEYDGLTVCKMLKSDPETAHIPIIFLTAKSENKDIIEGFAVGGVDYITKPFFQEELLARLQTHLKLTQMQQQLSQLYERKAELLTRLAHDVKNPAGAIHSLSGIVLEDLKDRDEDTAESQSFLELMNKSAKGLMELVEGTLNEELAEEDPIDLDEEGLVDVIEIIGHLVALNSVHAQKKSISIQFDATAEPKLPISRRILTEMFDNVINNAVKYSRPNSDIKIRISRKPDSSLKIMCFEVIDSAQIIPKEEQRSVFRKFQRGKNREHQLGSSHGVGLTVVKRLVEMNGGQIGITTREDGLGNIFYIHLPEKALPET